MPPLIDAIIIEHITYVFANYHLICDMDRNFHFNVTFSKAGYSKMTFFKTTLVLIGALSHGL